MRKRKQDLSEVTRMVFVEVDPVVMLTTSVSATSRVLPVLSDPGKLDQNQYIIHVKISKIQKAAWRA